MTRILCFAGSARKDSWNKALARVACAQLADHGVEATFADLADYPMPLYDGDLEAADGLPEPALRWKALLDEHDGLFIASPEYNSSITPLLKNAIDWASRPAEGEKQLANFRGKVAALAATSPGALGGLRGLVTVRSILGSIGMHVTPTQIAIPKAHEVFADGELKDEGSLKRLGAVVAELAETTKRLRG